jgi:hypothetical protein
MVAMVRVVFAMAVLCCCALVHAESDALRRLADCSFGPQLRPQSVTRRHELATSRAVQTSAGALRVSVADGYRVMLGFADGASFVHLRLDRSAPGMLGRDRAAILMQMTEFAARPGATVAPFKVTLRRGIEVMALDNPALQPSVVGVYTFISERHGIIATAYLLNQHGQRGFTNYQQYQVLREAFVDALSACMAAL